MSKYVDGFVIPVPKDKLEDYKKMAAIGAEVWKSYGALDYYETVGDDLVQEGVTSFETLAGLSENEVVIFAWIVYESREERDRINALVMKDPRIAEGMSPENAPFDCKRMSYGGFKVLVEA